MIKKASNPVVLVVLDGWGIAPKGPGNAISQANTPNFDKLCQTYPYSQLGAAGESVGLPRGEDGNSETGHLNLGAGHIVYQYLVRINMSIADGSFYENPAFLGAINHARKNNSNLHLMGLVGSGGVHSNLEHLFALLHLCAQQDFKRVFVHAFTDGRDSPPNQAKAYLSEIKQVMDNEGVGQIATVMGRYYSMDRDLRWERTQKAYLALTQGKGFRAQSAVEAVEMAYKRGETDEFISPTIILTSNGKPVSLIGDNDATVFYNYRIDRPRQLTRAFLLDDLDQSWGYDPYKEKYQAPKNKSQIFDRGELLQNLYFATMTRYEEILKDKTAVAFKPTTIRMPLGKVLALHGLSQLRVAESEKERFVTYYFNGASAKEFENQDTIIIASPDVVTYDQKPQMSSFEITEALLSKISDYDFAIINFAAPDMVAHSGNIEAAIKAAEAVDLCLAKLLQKVVVQLGGYLVVTADHGNIEDMINEKGEPDTEHSTNQVPFIVASQALENKKINMPRGILADVAPTILGLFNISPPENMTGRNLLKM